MPKAPQRSVENLFPQARRTARSTECDEKISCSGQRGAQLLLLRQARRESFLFAEDFRIAKETSDQRRRRLEQRIHCRFRGQPFCVVLRHKSVGRWLPHVSNFASSRRET